VQPSAAAVNYVVGGANVSPSPLTSLLSQPANLSGPSDFQRLISKPSSAGVSVVDNVSPQIGGKSVPMSVSRTIPVAAIARAIARAAPWVAAGMAAKEIADAIRARPDESVVPAQWEVDDGQVEEQTTRYRLAVNGDPSNDIHGPSAVAVCSTRAAAFTGTLNNGQPRQTSFSVNPQGNSCTVNYWSYFPNMVPQTYQEYNSLSYPVYSYTGTQCPAVLDALNPANSVAAGSSPGADGLCPTGRYNRRPSSFVEPKVAPLLSASARLPQITKEAMEHGDDFTPDSVPQNGTLSGPSAVTGSPTTSTTTDSSGVPTTVTTTPTTGISYLNNTYSTTNNYTSTVSVNNVVTSTTSTSGAADPGKTDCEKFPDSIGCAKFGDLPADKPVWSEKPIVYSEDALGLPAGCPPDRHMSFRGWDLPLRYGPLCDVAPTVKAGVIAMAALTCCFLVAGVLRQ